MTSFPKKIISLVDLQSGGHHETFALLYAQVLLELGFEVWIFFPKIEIFKELENVYGDQLKTFQTNFRLRGFKNKYLSFALSPLEIISRWKYTNKIIKEASRRNNKKTSLVFFLFLDSFLQPLVYGFVIDLVFSLRWAGLYLQPTRILKEKTFKNNLLSNDSHTLYSRRCQFVAVLDETITEDFNRVTKKQAIPFPDTIDISDYPDTLEREIRTISKDRTVIGLLGNIGKRKGLINFLKVIQLLDPQKYYFIIAGELEEESLVGSEKKLIKNLKEGKPENCYFCFRRINDGPEFNNLVKACDIISAVYNDFPHSSNMLTKAAFFKKFVVTSDRYLMSERVQKFSLGLCVQEKDSESLSKAIMALAKGTDIEGNKITPKFEEFYQEHSYKKLKSTLESALKKYLL